MDHVRNAFDRGRTPSAGRGLVIGGVVLAALLGVGTLIFSGRDRSPGTASTAGSRIEEPATTGTVSSSQSTSQVAPSAARAAGRSLRGVPEVLDTATLSVEGEVVRLFGVEWAPGAGKPDDLTQYLRGREITCEPAGGNDTYRCRVGEQDLSKVVLFNGGGKATSEATPELKLAEEKARTAQIGVWKK
jgi:endonuclease YncB( thermonuclease family)